MDKQFVARLQQSPSKGGWTYVVRPGSADFIESVQRGRAALTHQTNTKTDH